MSKPWAPLEKERKKTLKKRYVGVAASAHAAPAAVLRAPAILPPMRRTDTDPQLAHTAAAHHTHALNGVSCQRAQRRDAHTTSP